MATLINRSRYTVRVPRRAELTRQFTYTQATVARAYLEELRAQGHPAALEQGDDGWLVRIRQKGYPELNFRSTSLEAAESDAARIEAERRTGLFIDYTKGHRITFAELIERYVEEVSPLHKGCEVERAVLESLLSDSSPEAAARVLERKRARALAAGKRRRVLPPRHAPRVGIEWLGRPIAQVLPEDINRYVADRLAEEIVAPATMDRELDLLSQVITWAMKTLRIHLHRSPLYGVKRPSYYNERDRRLSVQEQARLFAAACEEDRQLAIEAALASHRVHGASLPNDSARKRYLRAARARIEASGSRLEVVPYYETLLTVLLGTAARRGEVLGLTWAYVNLESGSAYLPDTKNGRARSLMLRAHVVGALDRLPRVAERVFPMSLNQVRSAWYRLCARAELEDYHLHDLRHEALSQLCETARRAGAPLTVHELAVISGHRDLRCLGRYLNLCVGELAKRIDEAYQAAAARSGFEAVQHVGPRATHKGRIRPRIQLAAGPQGREATPQVRDGISGLNPTIQDSVAINKLPA